MEAGLLGWAGDGDEDIHEAACALLPFCGVCDVGDADQWALEVGRIGIRATIAGLGAGG